MECLAKIFALIVIHIVKSILAISGDNNCLACRTLADTVLYGLTQTEKAHHGGGNTAWEEEKLGTYSTSEMRFHDVMEYACKSTADKTIQKDDEQKCYDFLSDHEDEVEQWYFKQRVEFPDLQTWLCVKSAETCCPEYHWGSECQPCPGDKQRPCFGRGKCDGEGTRRGTGKCKCDHGYQGKLCRKCTTGFFASFQNDTHITCQGCNKACKGGCTGPKANHCLDCKDGWAFVDNEGCKDINECDQSPCKDENEQCKNTVGSYKCNCKENYKKEDGVCVPDVSEEYDTDQEVEDTKHPITDESEENDQQQSTMPSEPAKSTEEEMLEKKDKSDKPEKSEDKSKESIPVIGPKNKDQYQEPRPPMTEEHRRKVKDHLKQVMDTIESLQKGGGSLPRNRNVRYSDPQVQAVMDKLDKVKDKDDGYGIHRIEL